MNKHEFCPNCQRHTYQSNGICERCDQEVEPAKVAIHKAAKAAVMMPLVTGEDQYTLVIHTPKGDEITRPVHSDFVQKIIGEKGYIEAFLVDEQEFRFDHIDEISEMPEHFSVQMLIKERDLPEVRLEPVRASNDWQHLAPRRGKKARRNH